VLDLDSALPQHLHGPDHQRRQKAPVPSTYAPLKKVVLNAKTPSLFKVLRISPMTCALSGTRWIAFRKTTASAEETMRDTHSALPSMNCTTLDWIRRACLGECRGGRIDADHLDVARVSAQSLENQLGDRAGSAPRSTILRRPGPMTRSTIHRLTSVKKGCRVNASNEKRSSSAWQ